MFFLGDSVSLWENQKLKVIGNKQATSFLRFKNTSKTGLNAGLKRNIFQKIISWIFQLIKIIKYWELWFAFAVGLGL